MTNSSDTTSGSNKSKTETPADSGLSIEWVVHPVTRRPWVSVAVSVFVVAIVAAVRWATESQAFGILAMVIMVASLAKFYFPTRYRLDDKQIMVKTTTQTLYKEWSIYRSCYPDKNGLLLSPFAEPSRLENFRGLYLMFHDNRDEVTQFCQARIGKAGAGASQSPENSGGKS